MSRNRRYEAAIRETTGPNLYRLEQSGESATRADCVHEISLCKDHRLAGRQIRRDDCQWNSEIFKLTGAEHVIHQRGKTMVAGQAQAGNAPAGDISETQRPASLHDALERGPTGVGRAEDAAHAASGDVRNLYIVLLKYFKDA